MTLTALPGGLKRLLTDISLDLIFVNKINLPLPGLGDERNNPHSKSLAT
jgi:hypothetical protein